MKRLQQIAALLKSESTLALSTTDATGIHRSTPLFYLVDDGLCLYWFSSATSGHSKDLKRNNHAAAAIYRATANWKEIRGVQMRGAVTLVRDRTQRKAITAAYCERFHLNALFRAAISRSGLYRFRPTWIRYIDNARHFGYKFEISFEEVCEPSAR